MKLTINLKYDTIYGENLYIKGSVKSLHGKTGDGIPMEYVGNGSWAVTFYTEAKSFKYLFNVLNGNAIVNTEEELSHRFESYGDAYKTILIFDHFGMYPKLPRILQSAALSKAIRHHKTAAKKKSMPKVPIVFNTWSTSVNFNHTLSIVGSHPSLGSWNENDAVAMEAIEYPNFTKILDANKLQFPLEYKYAITDPKNGTLLHWEESYNHILNPEISMATDLIIVNDITPDFSVPDLRIAGTAVPIFSLRTKESFGCGEFLDLKKLGDWAYKTGQRIIQTLPINDTTVFGSWRDSYPYSSISVFALHPMYLNLEKIGTLKNEAEYKKKRKELNNQEFVDYEAVNKQKWMFIHEQFSSYGEATFSSPDYKTFFESNKYWLKPYAVFSFLRYKHDTADFSQWGEDAVFNPKRIDGYCQSKSKNYKDVAVHFFVQYHLHTQLLESVQYLHSKGIALKGDIPIGVNRNSVDVWMQPRLFDCNGSAGAPPDYFTKTGQVWGFPIYDWQEMAKDDYSWWKNRINLSVL